MKALLVVQEGPGAGNTYPLDPHMQSSFSMGRGAGCDIVVLDHRASRHHCDIRWNGRRWEVLDRGSTNGTQVNGQPLTAHEPHTLQPGDRVSLGNSVLVLEPPAATHTVTPVRAVPTEKKRRRLKVPNLVIGVGVLVIAAVFSAAILLMEDHESRPAATLTPIVITRVIVMDTTATPAPTDYPALTNSPPPPTDMPQGTPQPEPTETPESPDPTASVAESVQAEFERLAAGRILYNPPAEMQVGHGERIEVRISMDPAAPLESGLKGEGAPEVEAIPVSCFMKVRLQGETFTIMALSSEEQVIPAQGFTEWAWDVTPEESGDRSLFLVVTARVKLSGYADEQKDLSIIERQIHIKVDPVYSFTSFLKDNQGWIYTAILLPSVAGLGRWLWKRYRARKPSGSTVGGTVDKDQP